MSRTFVMGRCLGKGGFGEVYAATMTEGGVRRPVAVKLLHERLGDQDQAVRRMQDEARLLGQLSHPNILEVVDLTRLAGRVALVTEYVDGADLSTLIPERDLPPRVVLEIGSRVASALHAAYTADPGRGPLNLVHRDVKPSNIRIGRDGVVKLLDFGIARSDEITRAVVTASDMVVGSPPYLAPERFRKGPPHASSDVLSLGASLYEALTGRRLVALPLAVQAAHALEPDLWRDYVARRLDVEGTLRDHPALTRWLEELLAHDPGDRPSADLVAREATVLADALPGPSLVQWAHDRTWRPLRTIAGPLAGLVLEEDALHHRTTELRPAPNASASPPPEGSTRLLVRPRPSAAPAAPARRPPRFALLAGLSMLATLSAVAAVVAIAAAVAWFGRAEEPVVVYPPPGPPIVREGSPAAPETSAKLEPPGVRPSPPPSPDPAGPQPRVESAPGPALGVGAGRAARPDPRSARVSITGGAERACLAPLGEPDRCTPLSTRPVAVAPGDHMLRVQFDGEWLSWRLDVPLQPGGDHRIHCEPRMQTCALQ